MVEAQTTCFLSMGLYLRKDNFSTFLVFLRTAKNPVPTHATNTFFLDTVFSLCYMPQAGVEPAHAELQSDALPTELLRLIEKLLHSCG